MNTDSSEDEVKSSTVETPSAKERLAQEKRQKQEEAMMIPEDEAKVLQR